MLFHKTDRRNSRTLLFFVNNAIVIENDWVREDEYENVALNIESRALCVVNNSKRFEIAVGRILLILVITWLGMQLRINCTSKI